MKKLVWRGVLIFLGIIIALSVLDFATGYLGVLRTRTVEKAQMNADREVFESTQSYVEGKRQEASKALREYNQAESEDEKRMIRNLIGNSFANFDEEKYLTGDLYRFVRACKNGTKY